jgi:hypothetical protein
VSNLRLPAVVALCLLGALVSAEDKPTVPGALPQFSDGNFPGENTAELRIDPEVRVHINTPSISSTQSKPLLVFYALPNGNTIEQTIGKKIGPRDDWRYDIQHIGSQTRFLRKLLPDRVITIAYLEAAQRSWPAWRKKNGDSGIPKLIETVAAAAGNDQTEIALNGHSGGGSFIFGYLNALDRIPEKIVRIAFLDSNYAYDREAGHTEKLLTWLENTNNFLCVLAYDDASALLNGKPFVSASGGTWGRSQAMWRDFAETWRFTRETEGDLLSIKALQGRVQFLLMENPGKKILHTTLVERNGFIHSMVSGTARENEGYTYFGKPVWRQYVMER